MLAPKRIQRLDETVVNRIAAGEVIQRPMNALKELIENSLDAKSTNIQITVKEGGLKLLQIQDNGTGICCDDLAIVCERFTTSKLQNFDDLKSISTYGFRGEALASISYVAHLTITSKTENEKCAYKASYIDSKLKGPPVPCAGNQGTVITVEDLFYNVSTRRKALSSASEEFIKIVDVATKYAVHNANVGFTLKKHGETTTHVRTPQSSTKSNNINLLYGNSIAKELLEVELSDSQYKFKLHALITNANYSNKRMTLLLFINNRLVDSTPFKKTLEDMYAVYLPKKAHPWCYISLEIDPQNIDVNVHPTKHEVRFLHEDVIIEKIKNTIDEKLSTNDASRIFYIQSRLPKMDMTKEAMDKVLQHRQSESSKLKKIQPKDMIRMDASDQKLDRFSFTQSKHRIREDKDRETNYMNKNVENNSLGEDELSLSMEQVSQDTTIDEDSLLNKLFDKLENQTDTDEDPLKLSPILNKMKDADKSKNTENHDNDENSINNDNDDNLMNIESDENSINNDNDENLMNIESDDNSMGNDNDNDDNLMDIESDDNSINKDKDSDNDDNSLNIENDDSVATNDESDKSDKSEGSLDKKKPKIKKKTSSDTETSKKPPVDFKSYSVNEVRVETKLLSVLTLRKEIEDTYHEGLRDVLSNLIFIGCIDECSALIQSGVNLYITNTQKLAEELFYEIMLYDFANYGVIKFAEPILIKDLAMLGLDCEEAGWSESVGDKEELASRVQELLMEKADMLRQYFSIYIDKKGYLKSLPILLENYFPNQGELPLYLLRLSTEVNWNKEKPCFHDVCRETARFYSKVDATDDSWKNVTENVLYNAIKESLLPPKHFSYDSTILEITSLPSLYKIFERC